MAKTKNSNSPWKIVGILVAVIGVAIMAYGIYGMLAKPSYSGLRRAYPMGANASNMTYNQTAFNSTARRASLGMAGTRPGLYETVIGILTALLGVMLYKYAALKASLSK
jgi:nitrogen fixation protein FixH